METDKHLLELAAKAAGIPAYWSVDGTIQNRPMFVVKAGGKMGTMPYEAEWNPLKDDAAALRLAVKLGMGILYETQQAMGGRFIEVSYSQDEEKGTCKIATELLGDDPYAATRRAIVRAAAAMGSNIKPELDDAH